MIVTQSHVSMSAEHHKEESRTVLSSSGLTLEEERARAFGVQMDQSLMSLVSSDIESLQQANMLSVEEQAEQAREARNKLFAGLIDALFNRAGMNRGENTAAAGASSAASGDLVMNRDGLTAGLPAGSEFEMPTRTIQLDITMHESIKEYECTSFNACGSITTADGRQIDMNMSFSMERSYEMTRTYTETTEITFTDPLVLHFEGHSTELTDETYSFDLDADGTEDQLRFFDAASAFLALDRNRDGVINNGSELFGARSGNGFADLAAFDEDGNGYIDEADSVFNELKLWSKATDGSDILESLVDKGVGAIYLGSSETPFDIKDADNNMQAKVRASGFFLKESGEVGTVQQVDMVS